MRCNSSISEPDILIPTGVRTPVDSMSMRVLIGCTQALVIPGTLTVFCSSAMMPSNVIPSRQVSRGLSIMVVSSMVSGAGSVAVIARPTLPNTRFTSGMVLISLSVCCKISAALPALTLGNVVGIYSKSPSSSSGINSLPILLIG